MASVSLDNVQKAYHNFSVLKDISVGIDDGSFVTLVGPSGCGKSTLLRMIAGLESITAGTISIGGGIVNELEPKARNIAMVFQNYALYPHLTVAENMGFALKLAKADKEEIGRKVRHASQILGLDALLHRYPKQLSGGQRQRVAMGRAIVRNPAVFLFDEPLSNLDAKLRVQMRAEIKSLHQKLRTTTIYVTHDQVEAMTMADKIVVMKDGFIEQVGAPLDVYDRPANVFVAGFIGSPAMNFLKGKVSKDSFITAGGVQFPLPACADLNGRSVIYGIRPEHMHVSAFGVIATVTVIEPTGAETLVTAEIDGQPVHFAISGRSNLTLGSTVHIAPQVEHIHLFDETTGRRIN
ncbi:sn-glycerol-3-phosphate ABC transporter ATP-binding protein UgpC [Ochrobactrum soli]|uniref:ABC transporter ATP-binding protein n=1 Tax=Ochrobactrum soli TaxID=2448455 RepID=UPI000EF23E8B|nr:sn-glycerol-3-phosphate ABC transporter ATP-binding protein UgpC [[Ochrobactrum] soli]RLL64904.1 sn-glycerol-3-phosphate ABC transporter ATP-binding protein UgpC [[Ochrobactrum] soli]RRD25338.1 sn-glycerol-3-phosphate ABC transporter ATP-binding protein UgpC [Brucellaceae bacterium VT-16-1752]